MVVVCGPCVVVVVVVVVEVVDNPTGRLSLLWAGSMVLQSAPKPTLRGCLAAERCVSTTSSRYCDALRKPSRVPDTAGAGLAHCSVSKKPADDS
jgi:hypothetical protein